MHGDRYSGLIPKKENAMKRTVLYLPIGVPTFDLEAAKNVFEMTKSALTNIASNIVLPDAMLLSTDDLKAFISDQNPDLIVLQHVTFAHSKYAEIVFESFQCPIILWTVKEPSINGTRLRLNALTGAFSAGYAHKRFKTGKLFYLFGNPDDPSIQAELDQTVRAIGLFHELKDVNLLVVGDTPPGFEFGRATDEDLKKTFGVSQQHVTALELMEKARSYRNTDLSDEENVLRSALPTLEKTNEDNRLSFIKLYKSYKSYLEEHEINAVASRCWPDFFTEYKTPVCAVLGMLNEQKIAAACEADAIGALSMFIGQHLSKTPTYLGDLVSIDETENTATLWHCGTAACSLAHPKTGPVMGVHPNRKIGPTMEFGLRPAQEATIFRIHRNADHTYRFVVISAEILDKPQQFYGTSVVVRLKKPIKETLKHMILTGLEPHFVVIYGNVVTELETLSRLLDLETTTY
jgi:L-fucose isomerase-like protein